MINSGPIALMENPAAMKVGCCPAQQKPDESFDAVFTETDQKINTPQDKITGDEITQEEETPTKLDCELEAEALVLFQPHVQVQPNRVEDEGDMNGKEGASEGNRHQLIEKLRQSVTVDRDIKMDPRLITKRIHSSHGIEEIFPEFIKIEKTTADLSFLSVPSNLLQKSENGQILQPTRLGQEQAVVESQIVDQIIQKLSLTQLELRDKGQMTLLLEPRDLGKLKIEIAVDQGTVKAEILTSHIAVKESIERNQSLLLSALHDAGFNVEQFSVNVGNFEHHLPNEARWGASDMEEPFHEELLLTGIGEALRRRFHVDSVVSLYA